MGKLVLYVIVVLLSFWIYWGYRKSKELEDYDEKKISHNYGVVVQESPFLDESGSLDVHMGGKVNYTKDKFKQQNLTELDRSPMAFTRVAREQYVRGHSARYELLAKVIVQVERGVQDYQDEIFGSYAFQEKWRYDNQNDRDAVLGEYIVQNERFFKSLLLKVQNNKKMKRHLHKAYERLEELPALDKFTNVEIQMIDDLFGQVTIETDFMMVYEYTYTSPGKRNSYESKRQLSIYDVARKLQSIQNGDAEYKRRRQYIISHSERYHHLDKLVKSTRLKKVEFDGFLYHDYAFDTKQRYDNKSNRDSVIDEYIVKNKGIIERTLAGVHHNVMLERMLIKGYRGLENSSEIGRYKGLERQMIKDLYSSVSVQTRFIMRFKFTYTSPKGQNYYESFKVFSAYKLAKRLKTLENVKDERTEYEVFRDAERAKVTPGVRYDILKRDGFMCQFCGADANTHGVTLHVDHIVPIAKWGTSDINNLQTLCRDCNLGKGTKE